VFDNDRQPDEGLGTDRAGGVASDGDLSSGVGQGLEFARSLPAKLGLAEPIVSILRKAA
jgi:hypothetical protein